MSSNRKSTLQCNNVTSISHHSGAKIKVVLSDKGGEQKATFLGTKARIKTAMDLIKNWISELNVKYWCWAKAVLCRVPGGMLVRLVGSDGGTLECLLRMDCSTTSCRTVVTLKTCLWEKRPREIEQGPRHVSRPGSIQQRQDEDRTTAQHREETKRFGFEGVFLMIDKFNLYYGYFTGFVTTTRLIPAKVEPVEKPTRTTPKLPRKQEILTVPKQPRPTRADKGEVGPPCLKTPTCVADHVDNALVEYLAIVQATRQVNLMQCYKILQAYKLKNEILLQRLLDEAEGAIYDNNTHQVIRGEMTEKYMAAYSATGGFVAHDEEKSTRSGKITFAAPGNDPIVVTAKCTKIMLEDKILAMAQAIQGRALDSTLKIYGVPVQQRPKVPKIKWINGVPGCGKTTWVVQHFDANKDVVATTTIEAAKDLKQNLVLRYGERVRNRVRTMASILANGFREQYYRLTVDEALMNHFGSIIMAARLAKVSEIVLIGDVNQLPFLDRENLFQLSYTSPTLVASISEELLCTHRNPMDVAFALSDVYPGIYSAKQQVHSLKVTRYTGALIPRTSANTLYLVHTQKEKSLLKDQGYGSGEGSRMLTIHEAQGLTCENVIIINTKSKRIDLHDSMPHAIVAVSRHTVSCVYYTNHADDAIALFAKRAMDAPSVTIVDYNRKMAQQYRDVAVAAKMSKSSTALFSYISVRVFNTLNGIKGYLNLSMWYSEE